MTSFDDIDSKKCNGVQSEFKKRLFTKMALSLDDEGILSCIKYYGLIDFVGFNFVSVMSRPLLVNYNLCV